jgi:threonine dehydrogenase-like Zn-dependent dehydrogenase
MRATVMHAAGDVRIENVADPAIEQSTDAVIRITRACICGSDLWPYKTLEEKDGARVMGHEAIGVVEAIGRAHPGGWDVAIMPFAFSDGTCMFCAGGLQTACVHGGFFGQPQVPGAQAEAVRVPLADGTLYPVGVGEDDAESMETAIGIARPGGAVGRVGVVHRRPAAQRPRRADRARPRLRPDGRSRRRAGRLPRDERPRVDQGARQALTSLSRRSG